jgi:hypothetical protein
MSKPLKYINGPVSYYGIKFKYYDLSEKTIHLFGDYHFSKENDCRKFMSCSDTMNRIDSECKTIDLLLEDMIKYCIENDITFDYFGEIGYNTFEGPRKPVTTSQAPSFYLSDIYEILSKSKLISRSKLPLKNIRIHYSDIRNNEKIKSIEPFQIIIYTLSMISNEFIKYNYDNDSENFFLLFMKFIIDVLLYKYLIVLTTSDDYIDKINEIINIIKRERINIKNNNNIKRNYDKIYNFMIDNFNFLKRIYKKRGNRKIHYVKAEIDKLYQKNIFYKGDNITKKIENFINDNINSEISDFNNDIGKKTNIKDIFDLFFKSMIRLGVLNMDTYTLSRMIFFLDNPENQIVMSYMGDSHILNYVNFFRSLGLTPEPNSEFNVKFYNGNPIRCLESVYFKDIFDFSRKVVPKIPSPDKYSKRQLSPSMNRKKSSPKKYKKSKKEIEDVPIKMEIDNNNNNNIDQTIKDSKREISPPMKRKKSSPKKSKKEIEDVPMKMEIDYIDVLEDEDILAMDIEDINSKYMEDKDTFM